MSTKKQLFCYNYFYMSKKLNIEDFSPWAIDFGEVINKLETSEIGISEKIAEERLNQFGKNTFAKKERKNSIFIFLKQLTSPLIFILIGAIAITAALGEWVEVVVISLAVFVNAGLGFFREYKAENTLEKLATYIADRTRVIRNGQEKEIDSALIVPGDVVKLSYGSRIPADARIILANNFKVDEAILTGESVPEEKETEKTSSLALVAERKNIVHAGTLVVDGFATAVVFATGSKTEVGKIAHLVTKTDRVDSPIQSSIKKLAWFIFIVVLLVVTAIFVLGVFRGEPLLEMLILAVAVSVGAVPEALPITLTIILSIGAERIANKKGVIRTLAAAETLGSATLIMTDKTGTLTQAKMDLRGIYSIENILKTDDVKDESKIRLGKKEIDIFKAAISNVDVVVDNIEEDESKWEIRGRHLEKNIVTSAIKCQIDVRKIIQDKNYETVLPFNSVNKFSISKFEKEYFIMGAPDILLKKSSVSKDDYIKVNQWIIDESTAGNRILGIGKINKIPNIKKIEPDSIKDIEFFGIISFFDPIRPEVKDSIAKIESLGVKVIIITGDLKGTAISVAEKIGFKIQEDQVLNGEEVRDMSDEVLIKRLPNIKIFARVTSEDKLRIGKLYRGLGEIVAMTGDGVNDAPAIKAMDIGIAVGSGSDVAKSAADLVLLDDNFKTITLAIEEGRRILANIKKAFIYLMSNSLDEVLVIGGALIFNIPLPLTALQIIWVNLFTESFPVLAYAYDEDLDKDKTKRDSLKTIMSKEVNFLSFAVGILSSALLFILYYVLIKMGVDLAITRTVFFTCFSSYILVVAFSFRSLKRPLFSYNVFSNKRLNISILIAFVLLIGTLTIPFMRNMFDIAPLPFEWIWLVIAWIILNVGMVEIVKYFFRNK